jgi:ABC-2 type transport system ATP-binding protein
MIEAQNLTRYYGSFAALSEASFKIDDREIVGFLGLNGAGKSTLLRVLAGLLMPSSGRVTIGGVDATEATDVMRRRIGFLPEEPPLYREMRVVEFLRWVGRIKGRSAEEVDADLPKVVETCQLGDSQEKVIGELSHGYRKRVGIAQAIIHRPEVVILDEPISGLDPRQIVEMRSVVRSLKKSATVLISSHILSEIAQTCDRILVIHKGRIVAEGTENELGGTLGDATRIVLVLRAKPAAIEDVLGKSEHVDGFELAPEDDGFVHATVSLKGDTREALVRELVEAGIGVRGVQDALGELEQIFLELTRAPAAAAGAKTREAQA